jgi:hypothetical protein
VKISNVNRYTKYTCDSIKGSQDLHSVKFVGVGDVKKFTRKNSKYMIEFMIGIPIIKDKND